MVRMVSWRDDLLPSGSLDKQWGHLQFCNPSLFSPFGCLCFPEVCCQKGGTRGGLLQEGIRGDPGELQFWPFDPGPLHHRDQLQGLAPLEHSSQMRGSLHCALHSTVNGKSTAAYTF